MTRSRPIGIAILAVLSGIAAVLAAIHVHDTADGLGAVEIDRLP